jgi:hypothetical protein
MNDDPNTLTEEDGQSLMEWVTVGENCAVCEGLDGAVFTDAPKAVHPKCDCEVRPAPPSGSRYNDCEPSWNVTHYDSTWSPSSPGGPRDTLTVHVEIEAICGDGTVISDKVDVDFGTIDMVDYDTLEDELWFAVSDHVEQLLATHCGPCQPSLVS